MNNAAKNMRLQILSQESDFIFYIYICVYIYIQKRDSWII